MSTFLCQQILPKPINAAFSSPITIPMLKHTILTEEITRISHGAKVTMTTQSQTIQITSNIPTRITIFAIINPTFLIIITILLIINPMFLIINKTFPTKLHNFRSKVPLLISKRLIWRGI